MVVQMVQLGYCCSRQQQPSSLQLLNSIAMALVYGVDFGPETHRLKALSLAGWAAAITAAGLSRMRLEGHYAHGLSD